MRMEKKMEMMALIFLALPSLIIATCEMYAECNITEINPQLASCNVVLPWCPGVGDILNSNREIEKAKPNVDTALLGRDRVTSLPDNDAESVQPGDYKSDPDYGVTTVDDKGRTNGADSGHDTKEERHKAIYMEKMNTDHSQHHPTRQSVLNTESVLTKYPGLFHTKNEITEMDRVMHNHTRQKLSSNYRVANYKDSDDCCPSRFRFYPVEGRMMDIYQIMRTIVEFNNTYQAISKAEPCGEGSCRNCEMEEAYVWLLVEPEEEDGPQERHFCIFSVPVYCKCRQRVCATG